MFSPGYERKVHINIYTTYGHEQQYKFSVHLLTESSLHSPTSNDVQISMACEYCSARKYCYANVANQLWNRNVHMEIRLRINCFECVRVVILYFMKNSNYVMRVCHKGVFVIRIVKNIAFLFQIFSYP